MNHFARNVKVFICGSDQIWHPQNYNKNYFLDFGNKEAKRISFAASLPKSCIESQYAVQIQKIASHLKKFDKISVREQGSVKFISELSGKQVECVLDPTYLVPVEIWENCVAKMNLPDKYLFVYIPIEMDKEMEEYIETLKQETKINEVFVLMTRGEYQIQCGEKMKFVSLGEFLCLIKNAAYVFTSSFHAVVFSTIFQTNFLCYDVLNEERGEDLRLADLLSMLQLNYCHVQDKEDIAAYQNIDFAKVHDIIGIQSKLSFQFIEKALSF